ncbi:MAG: hypothetical protein QY316_03740 [Thermodesulfobacteriota bacterium]|nr:MAG: hypothetical protein QY316_03740 [Thermodesulfobacteriota bacterium]
MKKDTDLKLDVDTIELDISFKNRASKSEPTNFVTDYRIKISAYDVEEDIEFEIGEADVKLIRVEEMNCRDMDIIYMVDGISQKIYDIYMSLIDKNGEYVNAIKKAGITRFENILYVDDICLNPEYDEKGLEKLILSTVVEAICTCRNGMIIICLPDTDKDDQEACLAAREYYKSWVSFGFKPVCKNSSVLFMRIDSIARPFELLND